MMQILDGIKRPCIFVSRALSEQASKWGIMVLELELELELELYAFVYVRQASITLLDGVIVREDHK